VLRRAELRSWQSAKGVADVYLPSHHHRNPWTTIAEGVTGSWTFRFYRRLVAMASPLEGCVASLRNSMGLLDSSIHILADGVNDFPRLAKVLQTTRVSPANNRIIPIFKWTNTFDSTSNSSPNPIYRLLSPRYSQRSGQKLTTS
jgi:hypothetical protein